MNDADAAAGAKASRQRLDKWLWVARFYRTRSLAAEMVSAGRIRVNGARVTKPGHGVKIGDALTIAIGRGASARAVVVVVRAFAERRPPAAGASALYALEDGAALVEDGASADAPDDAAMRDEA